MHAWERIMDATQEEHDDSHSRFCVLASLVRNFTLVRIILILPCSINIYFCSFPTYFLVRMYCHIYTYNVSRIEYHRRLWKLKKKCWKKILEEFLSILLKIKKIFFIISFSISFLFPEIIDLENKGHFSTKMLIIPINLNQIIFLWVLPKELNKSYKMIFLKFLSDFFHGDAPSHKWVKILMIFIFDFWPKKKNKQTSECICLRRSIFCWNMKLWSMDRFGFGCTMIFVP